MNQIRMERLIVGVVAVCCLLTACASSAWAHSDIFVAESGGQVVVGGAHELGEPGEHFDLTTRVFEGVMIAGFPPFAPADYGRDEPGLIALASGAPALPPGAAALPSQAAVSIGLASFSVGGLTDTLFYWDGVGGVNFQPISVAQPGVQFAADPDPIGSTGASGGLHEHAVFTLDDGGMSVPADGVYLISPMVSVAGLAASRPFFMVFLADALLADEDAAEELEEALASGQFVVHGKDFGFFEEAVEYVENTLAIPEPAGAALAGIALGSFAMYARPRRARTEYKVQR